MPCCLLSRLTVEEHVWFYGCLKGMSSAEVKEEMASLLEDVGLLHKRREQTRNLSGALINRIDINSVTFASVITHLLFFF